MRIGGRCEAGRSVAWAQAAAFWGRCFLCVEGLSGIWRTVHGLCGGYIPRNSVFIRIVSVVIEMCLWSVWILLRCNCVGVMFSFYATAFTFVSEKADK